MACASAPRLPGPTTAAGALGSAPMSASSHQAEMSSVRTQLEELRARVEAIADRYQGTPDSTAAADPFETDRALTSAGRTIDRALTALSQLAPSQYPDTSRRRLHDAPLPAH